MHEVAEKNVPYSLYFAWANRFWILNVKNFKVKKRNKLYTSGLCICPYVLTKCYKCRLLQPQKTSKQMNKEGKNCFYNESPANRN